MVIFNGFAICVYRILLELFARFSNIRVERTQRGKGFSAGIQFTLFDKGDVSQTSCHGVDFEVK